MIFSFWNKPALKSYVSNSNIYFLAIHQINMAYDICKWQQTIVMKLNQAEKMTLNNSVR